MPMQDLGAVLEQANSSKGVCSVERGYIHFRGEGIPDYDIALERCATSDALVAWVLHLSTKTWMTMSLLRQFVLVATEHHGLKVREIPA